MKRTMLFAGLRRTAARIVSPIVVGIAVAIALMTSMTMSSAGAQEVPADPAPPVTAPTTVPTTVPTVEVPALTPLQQMFPGIGPDVTVEQLAAFFRALAGPPPPDGSGFGRRVVYSNRAQRVWLVEGDGSVARTYLVSGRVGLPKIGTYRIFSTSRYTTSGSVRMEYMMRFARGRSMAIGFHTIPVRRNGSPIQSLGELGSHRSHGCVRQNPVDAAFLWNWAGVGTTVVAMP